MDILQARQVLGKDGENTSDKELVGVIETAELFKNIFFDLFTSEKLKNLVKDKSKVVGEGVKSKI